LARGDAVNSASVAGEFRVLDLLRDKLGGRPSSPFFARLAAERPKKRYLIATTGRSGSTFLCSRIADYGDLGFPMEFLNESYISEFDRLFPSPNLADYERYVTGSFASRQGIFGIKTDWWRFDEARKLGLFDTLLDPIDLIVHLKRDDFVAQAVSLALAVESNVWHDRDVNSEMLDAWHAACEYDPAKVKHHARNLLNQEYYWRNFIAEAAAPSIELVYEDVAKDVDSAIRSLADAFDMRLGAKPPKAEAVRQAKSGVAKDWALRFREECADFVEFWREYRGLITAA
jgi:LPS sulfotransferase NodH